MNKEYLIKFFAKEWLFLVCSFIVISISAFVSTGTVDFLAQSKLYKLSFFLYLITISVRLTIFSIIKLKNK